MKTASFVIPGVKRLTPEQCQDFAADLNWPSTHNGWGSLAGNIALLVIADGVSGAPLSATGARLACSISIEQGMNDLPATTAELRQLLKSVHESWNKKVEALAKESGGRGSDYATTLTVAFVTKGRALVGSIGDGFAVALSCVPSVGDLFHLVMPQSRPSEEDANITLTLRNCDPSSDDLRVVDIRDEHLKGILISTDGLEEVAIRHRERARQNAVHVPPLYQAVQAGTVDWLLQAMSRSPGIAPEDLRDAIRSNSEIMDAKGDDIGVAIATWD